MKKKINANKKKTSALKQKFKSNSPESDFEESDQDTLVIMKGKNVDYTKFLLLFKLRSDPENFDSMVVVHSSEYRTIIETDQSRLDEKIDKLTSRNILMIYIKEYPHKDEDISIVKKRDKSVARYLHRSGIALSRLKILDR